MEFTNSILQYLICVTLLALSYGCDHTHSPDTHTHESEDVDHAHTHGANDAGHTHAEGERGDGHSHYGSQEERPAFTYLTMNGEFHLNPGDSMSQNDPRNPGRIMLKTSTEKGSLTKMTFFDHTDVGKKLAECGYRFIGSRPDPYYYPDQSKTSIWDVFEKVEDYSGDCMNYKYVLSRSPHGDPIHMHLRYGDDVERILAMSNDPEDDQFNPWWATYCDIDRTTACD